MERKEYEYFKEMKEREEKEGELIKTRIDQLGERYVDVVKTRKEKDEEMLR